MDSRLFFVLGDLLANLLIGVVVAWIVWMLVGTGWNMWFAMVLMMIAGMVIATILWLPLSIYLGAMEVMVPAMITGMLSGMVVGMEAAMYVLTLSNILVMGLASGFISIVFIWIMNMALHGEKSYK